jgi:hypothetical protein
VSSTPRSSNWSRPFKVFRPKFSMNFTCLRFALRVKTKLRLDFVILIIYAEVYEI